MKTRRHILPLLLTGMILGLSACSTTRVLSEGEYRLASNKVRIVNEANEKVNIGEIDKYIKQKPNSSMIFGWNPFLNIYNWSGDNEKSFWRKIGTAPVIFDQDQVAASVSNIEKHLEYIGYYNSKVEAVIKLDKKIAKVDYHVQLGKRIPIRRIRYTLPKEGPFAVDFLKDTSHISIKPGDYLSEKALEAESARSASHFRQLGYYSLSKNNYFFEADTISDPTGAILELKINEYTRNESAKEASRIDKYNFGKVNIYHPKSLNFKENVLRKMNLIHPGDPYSEDIVNNTYNRLTSLKLFSSVNIELNRRENQIVDCDINLNPSKLQGFKTNLEMSSNSSGLLGISPGLSYYNKNFLRGGEWLNLGFMGNFQFKPKTNIHSTEFGVSASISLPRFLLLPYSWFKDQVPRTEIKASYNYQNRPEYMRNLLFTSFGYTGYHKDLFYQFYPLQLKIVRLYHLDEGFYNSLANNPFMKNAYQDHFDLGAGGTLYFTNTNEVVPKGSYYFTKLQLDAAGNILSLFKPLMNKDSNGAGKLWGTPFSQYVRGELTLGKVWRLGKNENHAIATRFIAGAGYAYGNSKGLPFDQHFYGGGSNSLRGWQARSVGPGLSKADTTFVIPNQSGDMKLEANLEYRFKLFWKFEGALFADAGNVWTFHKDGNDTENVKLGRFRFKDFGKSIAADWGLGLRLDLNFILIRFDFGMKLHDPARDAGERWLGLKDWFDKNGCALHFGVGYPF